LNAAQPGDIIDVAPIDPALDRPYREVISVPSGVVLRSTKGPFKTRLELPTTPQTVPPRALVTLQASTRRTALVGFTIAGEDKVPIDQTITPSAGTHADIGLVTDADFQGYISGNVFYWWKKGIRVPSNGGSHVPAHPCWISGNTVVQCREIGIHVGASERSMPELTRNDPCRSPKPTTPGTVYPPIMPTLEHNLVIEHLQTGILVEAPNPMPATRVAFESLRENQQDLNGLVDDAISLNDNNAADPFFLDAKHQDFRLTPNTQSPALSKNARDERYRGALDEN
jgi:hypothetical protein